MRKILYSPGYGAGWSSWNSGDMAKKMLEYKPIIDFIESGGKFSYEESKGNFSHKGPKYEDVKLHPLLRQLCKECFDEFKESYVCILGASDLEVMEVSGRVRINQYDGYESVEVEDWM